MDPGVETVTVATPPGVDVHGDPTGPGVSTEVQGCSWQPRSSSEETDRRDTVTASAVLFAPPDTEITALSRVTYAGLTYEVAGEPSRWRDQDGDAHHVMATLRRVEG